MIICDSGWDILGNACYRTSGDRTSTWPEALAACRAMRTDADLTSILDETENIRVLAMIRYDGILRNNYYYLNWHVLQLIFTKLSQI